MAVAEIITNDELLTQEHREALSGAEKTLRLLRTNESPGIDKITTILFDVMAGILSVTQALACAKSDVLDATETRQGIEDLVTKPLNEMTATEYPEEMPEQIRTLIAAIAETTRQVWKDVANFLEL